MCVYGSVYRVCYCVPVVFQVGHIGGVCCMNTYVGL